MIATANAAAGEAEDIALIVGLYLFSMELNTPIDQLLR